MVRTALHRALGHRVTTLILLVAVAALGVRTCQSESVEATVSIEFGDAAHRVRAVRAELLAPEGTEALAYADRRYGDGGAPGPLRWTLAADPGSYRVDVEVTTATGRVRVERAVELRDRAVVTLDLEPDLSPRKARGLGGVHLPD